MVRYKKTADCLPGDVWTQFSRLVFPSKNLWEVQRNGIDAILNMEQRTDEHSSHCGDGSPTHLWSNP